MMQHFRFPAVDYWNNIKENSCWLDTMQRGVKLLKMSSKSIANFSNSFLLAEYRPLEGATPEQSNPMKVRDEDRIFCHVARSRQGKYKSNLRYKNLWCSGKLRKNQAF